MAIEVAKKLGYGSLRLPLLDDADQEALDYDEICKQVDLFMEKGFTYFDTSHIYHNFLSEPALKKCLVERYPRESYTFSDKLPVKWFDLTFLGSAQDVEDMMNKQLNRCGLEYFDFYLMHNLTPANYRSLQEWDAFKFLAQQRDAGKIRELGASFHASPEFVDKILTEVPEIDFVVLQLNWVDWESPALRAKELYEIATRHGKPVQVIEGNKGGRMECLPEAAAKLLKDYNPEASLTSWAYRFLASLPNVRCVIASHPKTWMLEDNVSYMENFVPLNDEELAILEQAAEIIHSFKPIPCTNCGVCNNICPKHIPIADYFLLYNDLMQLPDSNYFNAVRPQQPNYSNYLEEGFGAATSCDGCGECLASCPEKLDIPELMKLPAFDLETWNPSMMGIGIGEGLKE